MSIRTINIISPLTLTLLGLFCFVLLLSQARAEDKTVYAWSYYKFPPFLTEGNQGLTHDFVALLNERAKGRFNFHLNIMPRKRIDLELENNKPGIVLFVNPSWMSVPEANEHIWTSPLFTDRNSIISNRSKKVNYAGPPSVYGLKIGGVFGRKYKGLDDAIQAGLITREDTSNEELNVLKLSERRIDFMTAPESVLRYLVDHLQVGDRIYFSPTPLFEYTRHILINNASPELETFLTEFVEDLPTDPTWIEIKKTYHIQ